MVGAAEASGEATVDKAILEILNRLQEDPREQQPAVREALDFLTPSDEQQKAIRKGVERRPHRNHIPVMNDQKVVCLIPTDLRDQMAYEAERHFMPMSDFMRRCVRLGIIFSVAQDKGYRLFAEEDGKIIEIRFLI